MKQALYRKFRGDQRGNVAMIFALVLVPLLVVAGFAVDAQLAFSKKSKIQHAIDSAALAGARMMQNTSDEEAVREHASRYFDAIMANEEGGLTCESLTIQFTGAEEIEASARCFQRTTLTRLIGRDRILLNTSGTATYGTGRLDVAFVFDVSGSMNNYGRINDLKVAAKDAAETLLPEPGSPSDGDVRIAMASYNDSLNAGNYFEQVTGMKERRTYNAIDNYISDRPVKGAECSDYTCVRGWGRYCWSYGHTCKEPVEYTYRSSCVFERGGDHAFNNDQPKQLKTWDLLERVQSGTYNAQANNRNDDAYLTGNYAEFVGRGDDDQGYWREVGTSCSKNEPLGLTSNNGQITSYISRLRAGGGTAGHQGIAWGWYLISDTWSDVFTGDALPLDKTEPDVVKAMIVMTDGEFLNQHHSSQGNSTQQAMKLCDAIKKDDVIVYTIAFQAPQQGKDVLSYCASGPEFYFNAENGQELVESYRAIATSISDLRISR